MLAQREPILKFKPIRDILSKRPTLILREPLVKMLGLDPEEEMVKVDRMITKEELVRAVEMSDWARHLAEGMAKRGRLTPGTPEYEKFVSSLARAVAEGFVESILLRAR